ncbi:uncharacterized protein LOC144923237 [Branchiostoma floridae x Branchiostoma belcheri]
MLPNCPLSCGVCFPNLGAHCTNTRRGRSWDTWECYDVTTVPADVQSELNLDTSFYQKYLHAYGIPILGSSILPDDALRRACYDVLFLLADRKDVRDSYYNYYGRAAIMDDTEVTLDIPEHSNLDPVFTRARGLAGTVSRPVSTGAEENVLCFSNDSYRVEDTFIHGFAQGLDILGARKVISDFQTRLQAAYDSALANGLWANTFADDTRDAYWAEGVQSFFNVNHERDPPDGIHNHVNTRTELQAYDPDLYAIIEDIFPCGNFLVKRCVRDYESYTLKMDCFSENYQRATVVGNAVWGETSTSTAASQVDGGWTDWSPWSACSVTCGVGTKTRDRTCTNPAPANGGADCDGLDQETQDCGTGVICSVDGNWTDWSPWSACSVTCGVGTETRDRTCTNPAPANGGADCDGLDQEAQDCDTGVLCPVDGGWTDWSPWSACSVTCGVGTETRDRTCTNPAPANGGADCDGLDQETQDCGTGVLCPVDGYWTDWSPWSACSVTCGVGTETRDRTCTNPAPTNGGADCDGLDQETQDCDTGVICSVDGYWTDWSPWSACSVTCGVGTETRDRTCTNPAPANGGADCDGLDQEAQDCDTGVLCPVDGGWTDWSPWSACSVTCGVGTETRDRTCTNPAPANGGADCDGLDQETQDCGTGVLCPVDGYWTDWSPWSACSVTCGVGTETRDRTCTNPAPTNGGADCDGLDQETQDCDTGVICSAVSELTFHDIETDQMTLSWTASADVTQYRLRYRHAGASYQDLSPPPAPGETQATVRGLWADTEYNFTLTAFGEDDEEIGEISVTETTDKVIVNVDCHQDYMTVTLPRAALTEVNVETMHLLNDSCRATYTETEVTLRTGLQECGTIQESSADKIIFSNEAIGSPVEHDNGAVRGATFRKRFQCEFVSQFVVSQERNILFNIPPPRVEVENAENQFTFEMHMFTSPDFVRTYNSPDYPVQVTPSDHLNFGLSVNSPLDNLELLALHCLATPSTDPDDSPSVSIIQDGCDIDTTLQLNTDLSNDMALYYSIQSFTFPNVVDPSLVYIHCTMVVCFKDDPDSRCSDGCIPARRRRRAVSDMSEARVRRASVRDQTAHMTQGPFQIKNGQEQASTLPTVGIAVGAAAGIAGVLLLAVAVFLVRKRRRRDVKDQAEDRVGFDNYSFELWGKGKAANATPKPE